tara:strand:+ start:2783 stop:3235 length:453 start_codon:yes stop_codon:yes gene_type:complete
MTEGEWQFNGEPVSEDMLNKYYGFCYLITNLENGRKYIGRKYFWSVRRWKKTDKRRKRKESDWRNYWSSSKLVQEAVKLKGERKFVREILVFCKTKGDLNRIETYLLWKHNVLENDEFYNDSIGNMKGAPQHIVEDRLFANNEVLKCKIL